MSELFDIPESKSPRLLWLEKHGIWTSKAESGWQATAAGIVCKGHETEDDAIVNLSVRMGIKLWNKA